MLLCAGGGPFFKLAKFLRLRRVRRTLAFVAEPGHDAQALHNRVSQATSFDTMVTSSAAPIAWKTHGCSCCHCRGQAQLKTRQELPLLSSRMVIPVGERYLLQPGGVVDCGAFSLEVVCPSGFQPPKTGE